MEELAVGTERSVTRRRVVVAVVTRQRVVVAVVAKVVERRAVVVAKVVTRRRVVVAKVVERRVVVAVVTVVETLLTMVELVRRWRACTGEECFRAVGERLQHLSSCAEIRAEGFLVLLRGHCDVLR